MVEVDGGAVARAAAHSAVAVDLVVEVPSVVVEAEVSEAVAVVVRADLTGADPGARHTAVRQPRGARMAPNHVAVSVVGSKLTGISISLARLDCPVL